MSHFLLMEANTGFAVALALVLMIALMEILGMLAGFSLMNLLDDLLPINGELDISDGGLSSILGWFYLGQLPFLIWLVLFLTAFTIAGYSGNYLSMKWIHETLPPFISYPAALVFSLTATRFAGAPLARLLPKSESSAVSNHSFAGQLAQITQGKATMDNPAEAVLQDRYQKKHYMMVAPCSNKDVFNQGERVVLVEKKPGFWTAIPFEH